MLSYRHNPILSTTIFTHHAIDDTYVGISIRIDHGMILTSSHSGENLIETVGNWLICCCKHLFPFVLSLFYRIFYLGSKRTHKGEALIKCQVVSDNLSIVVYNVSVARSACPVSHLSLISHIDIIPKILESSTLNKRFFENFS